MRSAVRMSDLAYLAVLHADKINMSGSTVISSDLIHSTPFRYADFMTDTI